MRKYEDQYKSVQPQPRVQAGQASARDAMDSVRRKMKASSIMMEKVSKLPAKSQFQNDFIDPGMASHRNAASQLAGRESSFVENREIRKANKENNSKNFQITYRDYASRFNSLDN